MTYRASHFVGKLTKVVIVGWPGQIQADPSIDPDDIQFIGPRYVDKLEFTYGSGELNVSVQTSSSERASEDTLTVLTPNNISVEKA